MNVPRARALHCSTAVTRYTTPQDHSLSLCFPFIQCLFLSLFILSFHLPLLLSTSLYFIFFLSTLSLSGLRTRVSLLNPPYQHVWLMKKGNVCWNSIILTCWWQRERDRGGVEKEKQRKTEKKQYRGETSLTEVQLALPWTKDVIILFKITPEKLAIKRFITLCVWERSIIYDPVVTDSFEYLMKFLLDGWAKKRGEKDREDRWRYNEEGL